MSAAALAVIIKPILFLAYVELKKRFACRS
jgi:hypothetical protein